MGLNEPVETPVYRNLDALRRAAKLITVMAAELHRGLKIMLVWIWEVVLYSPKQNATGSRRLSSRPEVR